MEKLLNEIRLNYTDGTINALLQNQAENNGSLNCYYNQSEEMFVHLEEEFEVPAFPIHHDIEKKSPSQDYLEALKAFLSQVVPRAPTIFRELTYFFDPTEILHPCFYQLFKIGDLLYLYLLRLDLMFHTHQAEIVKKGSNDHTPVYRTYDIFLESDLIPLERVETRAGKLHSFVIHQTISQTWIGETGRGYFLQGIWMDNDLTKFFSKLFLPPGKRTYPYYPFSCKFRTLCLSLLKFAPEDRKKFLPLLHKAQEIVAPEIEAIQNSLKNIAFSEELPAFKKLKTTIPSALSMPWSNLKVVPYLNSRDMKEFRIEFSA